MARASASEARMKQGRHPAAARVVRAWRELTGQTGRGRVGAAGATLLACSGGADSSALVLALARLGPAMTVAHIVHDLRPEAEALGDRDAAASLALRAGLRFVEARVRVKALRGNMEANARRKRYAALAKLAAESGCRYIATAHHADDQLETVIMRLLRGAGPRGLGGIAPTRRLGELTVIRPMLGVTRAEAEAVCAAAGWTGRVDATNADESRVRARLRARVLPLLREIRPDAAARAARSAGLVRAAAGVVEARARGVIDRAALDEAGRLVWARADFRMEPEVVVGEVLRAAARRLSRGAGMDRVGAGVLERAVRAARDSAGGRRELRVGPVRVWVMADVVIVERAEGE